jgi:hypothetical protein
MLVFTVIWFQKYLSEKERKAKGIKSGMYVVRSLQTLYWCDKGDTDSGDGPASVEMLLKREKVGDLAGLNAVLPDVTFDDDVVTWKR